MSMVASYAVVTSYETSSRKNVFPLLPTLLLPPKGPPYPNAKTRVWAERDFATPFRDPNQVRIITVAPRLLGQGQPARTYGSCTPPRYPLPRAGPACNVAAGNAL